MKTIGTNPPTKTAAPSPDLIEDSPSVKPAAKGAAIGELVGGHVSKELADLDLAAEEAHWRENHASQPFAKGQSYEDLSHAYRTGYEGYSEHGMAGKTF